MTQLTDIEKFYKDVKDLKLRFPVASISEATKESKGNVSKILNHKLTPSSNFITTFYKAFAKHFKDNAPEIKNLVANDEGQPYGFSIGFDDLATSVFRQQAILEVLLAERVEDVVKIKGASYNEVSAEYENAVNQRLEVIESKFRKGQGKHV